MSRWLTATVGVLSCLAVVLMQSPQLVRSADPYKIDALFVVDSQAVHQYKLMSGDDNIRPLMESTVTEISEMIKSLNDFDFEVDFRVSDIVVLDKNLFKPDINGVKVDDEGLVRFRDWLSQPENKAKYHFDLALMYTGFDMDVRGRAFRGGVCKPGINAGIVKFKGTYNGDAYVGAHEIGHMLGAEHNTVKTCKGNGPFLLHRSTVDNHLMYNYRFSPCSAKMIRKTYNDLNTTGKNCLTEVHGSPVTGIRYGSVVSPDEICQRTMGSDSFLSRGLFPGALHYKHTLCRYLLCTIDKDTKGTKYIGKSRGKTIYYRHAMTPPGTVCGKSQQCFKGKCIKVSGSEDATDNCPIGNQPKVDGKTCADFLKSECPSLSAECCQSCGTDETRR